jgi:H/ACA ribonucleoprotein complex subunit 2
MAPESTPKKEKKDKKRKSEAAELSTAADGAVTPVAVPPPVGTASAEAVVMEVEGEKAAKKAKKDKKDKRKSLGGDAAEGEEKKVSLALPCLDSSFCPRIRPPCILGGSR